MSNSWKRFLSLLLVMTMILSLGVTGFADAGAEDEPAAEDTDETPIMGPDVPAEEPAPEDGELEMIDISPDKLGVRKLGVEETEDEPEEGLTDTDKEDLEEIVRVSIFLDAPSTLGAGYSTENIGTNGAAIAYRNGLKAQQDALTAQIESVIGHELNVHWNITLAANAISADLSLAEIVKVREIPGVKAVQRETLYLPMEGDADPDTANTSENMVGAWEAWNNGYTGAGSRIAIVDTGIDTSHQSFAEEPFTYAVDKAGASGELMTRQEVQGLASQLNSGTGNYVSAKIPYGYNYVDNNTTIDHVHDTEGNHGSHVAGIAAANRYIGSSHKDAIEEVGAVGMAPDAQLLIMKVFGSNGGAYDSDYFVAIEDAIVLGADACNLSLGSGAPGWTFDNTYQDLLNGWTDGDHNGKMVLSISAGNSGAATAATEARRPYIEDVYTHTGGSPGSYVNSLCVAAAQNTLTTGKPLKFNDQSIFYTESTEGDDGPYTNPEISTIAGAYDLVYIDATGSPEDYSAVNSALSLSGKIVIVNRGGLTFSEKGNNAINYSPKALIVANNADGTFGMVLSDYTGTFPMVSITLKDANTIKTGCEEHTAGGVTYYTGRITVTNSEESMLLERSEATITDFSSWGVPGSLLMKPEITAPGGNIYSVFGTANTSGGGTEGGTDKYVSYDGTSMAAPHIAGLAGVLAEYLRENDLVAANSYLAQYSTRAIAQSLMMSTATPMMPEGEYLSILQQGAGLAEVARATSANSVIMMSESESGLTGKTGAAKDGKVKVELGDDPDRTGDYSFGFTVYNLTDDDLQFTVTTDIFTQATNGVSMASGTAFLNASCTDWWEPLDGVVPADGHDVDQDGDTDADDAQAILDFLSGEKEEESLDLSVADLDADDMITSQDAYLLLGWESGDAPADVKGLVPAHGKRYCAVRITLPDSEKADLDFYFPNGAFIEGFTYVTSTGTTKDGGKYEDEHSIPILGFYGSWTDPTMFETTSYTEALYGNDQLPYSGTRDTNYLTLNMNGANTKFSGNPYMVESEFPTDRLAINSNSKMVRIAYNLIRSAATTGFAVSKLDKDEQVSEVVSSSVIGSEVTGLWYYVNQGSWQNTGTKIYSMNKTPADYGLAEGDVFRVGFYAIPEYYGMLVNEDYTGGEAGVLDSAGFKTLLERNELGKGAFVGFDFVVDDTEPQILSARLDGSELTVAASDDRALAYVAVMSLDGEVVYSEAAPGESDYTVTLDASDAIANAFGYVAVFAGDYAGNEAAVAVKVNDNTHVEKTFYVLTNSVTAGEDYVIVNANTPGDGYALNYMLNSSGSTATISTNALTIKNGNSDTNNNPYIETMDVSSTAVWTAGTGSSSGTYTFNNNGWYLRLSNQNNLTITKDTSRRDWTWDGTNNRLSIKTGTFATARYLRYASNTFSVNTSTSSVYLFQKTVISYEVDPYGVSSISITPDELFLYKGDSAELAAKVLPLTAADRTVTWSSSDTSVATVDESGRVTAVGVHSGNSAEATITARSNSDPTHIATCIVHVLSVNKTLNSIVWDEEGAVYFSDFNANSLPTWNKLHNSPVGTYLSNAFMYNASTLYAGTLDNSDASTTWYTVNRSTYALTEFGQNYVGAFGVARGPTGFESYGYKFMVYGFAGYLIMGNVDPDHEDPDDSSSAMYSGLPYGLLNLSETTVGDAYVCGVCAKAVGSQSCTYYFLDETGKIWLTTLNYSSSDGFTFTDPILQIDTGIGSSFFYQSLYYDGTYLYWSHQADNVSELIIYAPSTGKLYHAGNFGDGVWPAAGLYVNGSAAPASVEDEIMGGPIPLRPLATREQLLTADVLAKFARFGVDLSYLLPEKTEEDAGFQDEDELPLDEESVEEPAEGLAPAENDEGNDFVGGLNAFRGLLPAAFTERIADLRSAGGEVDDQPEENQLTVSIFETEDTHNGLIALTYDPELLTFLSFEAAEEPTNISVHVDKEKGVITIAYANKVSGGDDELPINSRAGYDPADDIPAETELLNITFATSCEDDELELLTLERNDELELDEQAFLEAPGTGHDWAEPVWTWTETEDGYAATATFVCRNNDSHTEELEAEVTSETTPASCEEAGSTVYTASVEFEGETYTDTTEVEIEAIGHNWGEPTWEWAEDCSAASATFVCANDETHVETLNAELSSEVVGHERVYTATVEFNGETYTDTKSVSIAVTVTFDAGEGVVDPATVEVNMGESIETLPIPTREDGWVFIGWFTEPAESYLLAGQGTPVTAETTFDEDTTVYAHWRLPGDINGDGRVNNKDVTRLVRYLKGEEVEVVEFNLDTNGDGKVNNKDLTRLARFIKSGDVELH